jgi:hypothetical protein
MLLSPLTLITSPAVAPVIAPAKVKRSYLFVVIIAPSAEKGLDLKQSKITLAEYLVEYLETQRKP